MFKRLGEQDTRYATNVVAQVCGCCPVYTITFCLHMVGIDTCWVLC